MMITVMTMRIDCVLVKSFSSILSIGSSLGCLDRDYPGYQRFFSRFGMLAEQVTIKDLTEPEIKPPRARVNGDRAYARNSRKKFTAKLICPD